MAVKIGHSAIDENGGIYGGQAGDQNGREVCVATYYNMGHNVVLRPKKKELAEKSAVACEKACANDKIGYAQDDRNTLYARAKEVNFDLAKITTPCECDCSSLQHLLAIIGGANLTYGSNGLTTRTMVNAFVASGDYEKLTASKYLTSDKYLLRGDVLVKEGSHTVMILSDGECAIAERHKYSDSYKKTYIVTTSLNLRKEPDADSDVVVVMPKDAQVVCDGYYNMYGSTPWLHIKYDKYEGFCSSRYLSAKVEAPKPAPAPTPTPTPANKFMWNGLDCALIFNPAYYSNKYADLKRAFGLDEVKLFNHFITYGMRECRQATATFDVVAYKNYYADLRNAFGDNMPLYYKHYLEWGYKENRKTI